MARIRTIHGMDLITPDFLEAAVVPLLAPFGRRADGGTEGFRVPLRLGGVETCMLGMSMS
jgi:hypothetical protein